MMDGKIPAITRAQFLICEFIWYIYNHINGVSSFKKELERLVSFADNHPAGLEFFVETEKLRKRLVKKSALKKEAFVIAGLQTWTELHYSGKKFPFKVAIIVIDLAQNKHARILAEMLLWDEIFCNNDSSLMGRILKRLTIIGDDSLIPILIMAKTSNYRYFIDTGWGNIPMEGTSRHEAFMISQRQFEMALKSFPPTVTASQ